MAEQTKLLSWNDERAAALAEWVERGRDLGIDMTAARFGGKRVHSDAAAIGAALKHAAACRCAEHEAPPDSAAKALASVVALKEMTRVALGYSDGNPLRAIRESAGLSQNQMAARMGVSKRAVQVAEARAKATEDMVTRFRKAVGK